MATLLSRPRVTRGVRWTLGLLVLGLLLAYLSDAPANWLVLDDALPDRVDAALVMAGDPGYERTTTAARLVTEGRARLLIITGGEPGPGDSASSLRAWAIRQGVPEEKIRTEMESTGTHSSMLAVQPALEKEGVRLIALVTSPYHQRRASLSAAKVFGKTVKILNHPARPSFWSPRGWWRSGLSRRIVFSEYMKLGYYRLRRWI